jgi:hypothetical protein
VSARYFANAVWHSTPTDVRLIDCILITSPSSTPALHLAAGACQRVRAVITQILTCFAYPRPSQNSCSYTDP